MYTSSDIFTQKKQGEHKHKNITASRNDRASSAEQQEK